MQPFSVPALYEHTLFRVFFRERTNYADLNLFPPTYGGGRQENLQRTLPDSLFFLYLHLNQKDIYAVNPTFDRAHYLEKHQFKKCNLR